MIDQNDVAGLKGMGRAEQDPFLEWLNDRISLLSESTIRVMAHEVSVEAEALRIEERVLRKVRDKYLGVGK